MISIHDGINSVDIGNFYLILPMNKEHSARVLKYYKKKFKIKKLNKNFSYNSKNNNKFRNIF